MEDCIFCRIAAKEAPATIVYEDDWTVAFLDINPGAEGHTLVVPKAHAETLMDMDEQSLSRVFSTTAKIARAVKKSMNADGIGIYQNNGSAAGQLVMHMHVHVVPRKQGDGFTFNRFKPTPEELAATAEKIKEGL